MSIARVTMHEYHEEGMHDKIEELYASIVDEHFPNLEQVINIKTGPTSAISLALYPSFEEAEKNLGDRTKMVELMTPYVKDSFVHGGEITKTLLSAKNDYLSSRRIN